ncbi:uridine phosphorylase [Candidatus Peregrinibacteria bacterium CG10_big_fil_rev_8_21_14_0_10_55_24]|nr:MAG: uridine phosphorylase [Candidatus Peregrinibacteria bacterium CG10_big_fil_rev_8_21_14_0_10_55_24]
MSIQLNHLQCSAEDIAPIVLMPSNPAKADWIASTLDDARKISQYREFTTWTGLYKTVPISVISTGIGCPSTAIAVEEAIAAGARILIRVGTCGGAWRAGIPCGSIIVPTACVREEGTTQEYLPLSYPAVADYGVVRCIEQAAAKENTRVFSGINRTHDAFYGSKQRRQAWAGAFDAAQVPLDEQPILSSEMECSVLFVLASMRNVRAGAVLAVNADPEPLTLRSWESYSPIMRSNSPSAPFSEQVSINLTLEAVPGLQKLLLQ